MNIQERIKDILTIIIIISFAMASYNIIMFSFIMLNSQIAKDFLIEGNFLLFIASILVTRRGYKKYLSEMQHIK